MLLLAILAFLSGGLTAVSPCVLPVLPALLVGGSSGGARRPLGIVIGLAASFTFTVAALTSVIDAIGLPDDTARIVSVVVLAGFGVVMIWPRAGDRVEAFLSRFVRAPTARDGDGFVSGLVLGVGLGFVYLPCAGPILGAVTAASITQDVSLAQVAIAASFGLGTAVMLFMIMRAGRTFSGRIRARSALIGPLTGAVMLLFAIAIAFDLDTRFQQSIKDHLPEQVVNPTRFLEDSDSIKDNLADVRGSEPLVATAEQVAARGGADPAKGAATGSAGDPSYESDLPVLLDKAPEFVDNQQWFNTPDGSALTLEQLQQDNQVVLIDFWTYTCINCLRTLPYVTAWDRRYRDQGLTVVGVHSPEFSFERDPNNVADAITANRIEYPVVQDNNLSTWSAWHNQYWPAKYLIDAQGRVRYTHFGEGDYDTTEEAIRSLLREARGGSEVGPTAKVGATETVGRGTSTPETYLGSARAQGFINGRIPNGRVNFGTVGDRVFDRLPLNAFAYQGQWGLEAESATALEGARLDSHFNAGKVFLVLGSNGEPRRLQVFLDGKPIPPELAGSDVDPHGFVTVDRQRLYRLVELPEVGAHNLSLHFASGLTGYAFTYG